MSARSGWSLLLKSRKGFSELRRFSAATRGSFVCDSSKWCPRASYSDFARQYTALSSCGGKLQGILEANARTMLSLHVTSTQGAGATDQCFARSFASKASHKDTKNGGQTRKEVSTIDDPFDAPTYNIPEKPVTFTEGASYSIVILAGLGVAVAAGYAVFKELIFEPKEYKVFNKALKRIQDDSQVRVRIGSPITGYGQESRNRAARQRIANKVFTDEDGVEHVQIGFYIRGPHGAGKVAAEMFKDNVDKQWKYTYLIVQITQPSQSQLILESYIPAPPVRA